MVLLFSPQVQLVKRAYLGVQKDLVFAFDFSLIFCHQIVSNFRHPSFLQVVAYPLSVLALAYLARLLGLKRLGYMMQHFCLNQLLYFELANLGSVSLIDLEELLHCYFFGLWTVCFLKGPTSGSLQ